MFFYFGIAASAAMVIGSTVNLYKKLNESVIIKKTDFINIEKRIRLDERRKMECQLKKN